MFKIILSGYNGQMGKVLKELINDSEDMEITFGVDRSPTEESFNTYESFSKAPAGGEVIIDFSHHSMVASLLDYIENTNTPAVICTTGISAEDMKRIDKIKDSTPIFMSGNMSLGINLLISLVKEAAKVLENDFDIEIIEKHHNKKVDSPSGTAYMIADSIKKACQEEKSFIYGREGNNSKREKKEIGIHAVRGGTIVGEHQVIFAGTDEIVEITHKASSKKIFAKGAMSAARFLIGKDKGLYDMNNIFGEVD